MLCLYVCMSVDGRRETKEDRRVIIYSNQVQGNEITTIALNLAVGRTTRKYIF
jgi:hypothetical protein